MLFKNTEERYGIVAIIFHWIMAILIIGMISLGLYMADLPNGPVKIKLFGLHKEFGMLILMLVTLRIIWRLQNQTPRLSIPRWQKWAAHGTHFILYTLMIAMPITGWLVTSAAGFQVSFFGMFLVPNLIPADEAQMKLFAEIHEWLAYGLIAVLCLHVAAALKHHFIDKDNILIRMFS